MVGTRVFVAVGGIGVDVGGGSVGLGTGVWLDVGVMLGEDVGLGVCVWLGVGEISGAVQVWEGVIVGV
jgi:hypothetical protein